jgi:hypothetical protein
MRPFWKAKALVPTKEGSNNKWVCAQCEGKRCIQIISVSAEPNEACKEEL